MNASLAFTAPACGGRLFLPSLGRGIHASNFPRDAERAALQRLRTCPCCLQLHLPTVPGGSCLSQQLELGGNPGLSQGCWPGSAQVTQPFPTGPQSIPHHCKVPPRDIPGPQAFILRWQVAVYVSLRVFLPLSQALVCPGQCCCDLVGCCCCHI